MPSISHILYLEGVTSFQDGGKTGDGTAIYFTDILNAQRSMCQSGLQVRELVIDQEITLENRMDLPLPLSQ